VNGLKDDKLVPGMNLKVPTYKLNLVVDKSQNTLVLKGDEDVLKTYTVSTGINNSTPVGTFKITDKLINPTWYKAGAVVPHDSPENVLGSRWMGLSQKGYGIHGTTEPEKLGQQVTAGCVRMRNEEVEELYALIPPGTEVTIVD
jgi:lipoprotein-anchoring transpeptidase ErfK/SrfK